jgi:hypothetical protein
MRCVRLRAIKRQIAWLSGPERGSRDPGFDELLTGGFGQAEVVADARE